MASVRSMCIAVLSLVCCLCGCGAVKDALWWHRLGQIDKYHAELRRQYAAEVAAHAARGWLVGTWVRREERPSGKKFGSPITTTQTLALFRDGRYTHKATVVMSILSSPTTIVTGEWRKTGPGKVQLTVTGKWREEPRGKAKLVPLQTPETQTIDLKEWTNPFVEADAALMSEAAMQSGGRRPHTRTAE